MCKFAFRHFFTVIVIVHYIVFVVGGNGTNGAFKKIKGPWCPDGSLLTRIHDNMRVGETWTHWISSRIHVQNRTRGWNRNVCWWLQTWVTHLRRNKCQRVGKVFVRVRVHGKIVPNVTRDFRNNQFAPLSIRVVLPNNVTLTMSMMCPTKVDTWSSTHVRMGAVNVIVIQMHGTEKPVTLESGSVGFAVDGNILRISTVCKRQYALVRSGASVVNIIVRSMCPISLIRLSTPPFWYFPSCPGQEYSGTQPWRPQTSRTETLMNWEPRSDLSTVFRT